MNVRCPYCRTAFNLGRDYLVQVVAEADANRQKYHMVECIGCRKKIKVPIKQMRRFVPRPAPEEQAEAQDDAS